MVAPWLVRKLYLRFIIAKNMSSSWRSNYCGGRRREGILRWEISVQEGLKWHGDIMDIWEAVRRYNGMIGATLKHNLSKV